VKLWGFVALFTYFLLSGHALAGACSPLSKGDARWQQLDREYARIEQATVANNAKQLFAVYAPDFEAHQFNGEVFHSSSQRLIPPPDSIR
jgi:hypothetical protein